MEQGYITGLLERPAIGILSFHEPDINTLSTELALIVTIPWFVDVKSLEDQSTPPVKDLQVIVKHCLPYRREEELIHGITACRQVINLYRSVRIWLEDRGEDEFTERLNGHGR